MRYGKVFALLFLDASPNPFGGGAGALVLLLAAVFIFAVSFTAGLVFLLIWLKRRKANSS
jgi:hypothetical protein